MYSTDCINRKTKMNTSPVYSSTLQILIESCNNFKALRIKKLNVSVMFNDIIQVVLKHHLPPGGGVGVGGGEVSGGGGVGGVSGGGGGVVPGGGGGGGVSGGGGIPPSPENY